MMRLRAALPVSLMLASSAGLAPFAKADPADTALATIGKSDAKAVIDVYEDYLCPYSAAFERQFGDRIDQAAASVELRVRYHMLRFLDPAPASKDYSSRAAAAASAVFQNAPEAFAAFHKRLFSKGTQPKEKAASDLTDDQLVKIARETGAAQAVSDIQGGDEAARAGDLADASTEELRAALGDQVSVPTVLENSEQVDVEDKNWLGTLIGERSSRRQGGEEAIK